MLTLTLERLIQLNFARIDQAAPTSLKIYNMPEKSLIEKESDIDNKESQDNENKNGIQVSDTKIVMIP